MSLVDEAKDPGWDLDLDVVVCIMRLDVDTAGRDVM